MYIVPEAQEMLVTKSCLELLSIVTGWESRVSFRTSPRLQHCAFDTLLKIDKFQAQIAQTCFSLNKNQHSYNHPNKHPPPRQAPLQTSAPYSLTLSKIEGVQGKPISIAS